MEVILLEKVGKLGNLGTKVRVKPGYARNCLIPKGQALPATANNIERFEANRAELEKAAATRLKAAEQRATSLEGAVVNVEAQAGEEGRLFGSVGPHEIVRALANAGHTVSKGEVRMPEGPIRQVGEYELELQLQGVDVRAKIKVVVIAAA